MSDFGSNPFTLVSIIGGPAILTNASSLLILSTSNRFARTLDRARTLAAHLLGPQAATDPIRTLRMQQLARAERRSLMLVTALRAFYLSLGAFATASLVSLIGAWAATRPNALVVEICLVLSLLAGGAGVGSLAHGCTLLVRETRLAFSSITEEAALVRARLESVDQAQPLPDH